MSTLRINNIEAQSIPASPTIDEKVKVTNSSGDILVNIDGKTSGITTIGINTTDGNIKFDANSNVLITGILTATTLAGNFTPDSLEIGSNIKLGNAGVITATSFVGSGANLTGVSAVSVANQADNRVITNTGTTDALNAEANLTFSGSELVADSSMITAQNTGAGSGASKIQLQPYGTDGYINCTASGNLYTRMGTGFTTRTQIDSSGNFTVSSGNLVIGTAGKGIDFSATGGPAEGSGTSELFHDYEEGTFTPVWKFSPNNATGVTYNIQTGHYVKVGGVVFIRIELQVSNKGSVTGAGYAQIDGLPYACSSYSAVSIGIYQHFNNVQPGIAHVGTSEQVYIAYDPSLSSNTSSYDLQHTYMTNNSRINISGTYYAV